MIKTRRARRTSVSGVIGKIALIVAAIVFLVYFIGVIFFKSHFVIGTEINGVNCSMKNVASAEEKITKVVQNYEITVEARENKKETLNGKHFDMDVVFDDSMNDLLKEQNPFLWFLSFSKKSSKSVGVTISYNKEQLEQNVLQLECMQKASMQAPVNASIAYNSEKKQYEVVEEVLGTTVDTVQMQQAVADCVENLKETLSMEKEQCYVAPEYTKESDAVKEALEKANKYVATKVTYDYTTEQVEVNEEQISQWLVINEDMKVSFDKEKVQQFVSDMASKFDTIFTTRTFKTSYNEKITLTQGDYGWWTNRVEERKDLIRFIKKGVSGEKEPVYYQKAVKRGTNDIGDTYVEVNLTKQHVLLYKNGKKIKESDCVTGRNSSPTPTGIYSVTYKDYTYEGHQVQLVGENYASDVSFFIPFSGNVGLHDASWRRSFGGNQYKTQGSHGCVNLPYDMAKAIFDTVEKGMPVIVYEEGGSQQAATTQQSATTQALADTQTASEEE